MRNTTEQLPTQSMPPFCIGTGDNRICFEMKKTLTIEQIIDIVEKQLSLCKGAIKSPEKVEEHIEGRVIAVEIVKEFYKSSSDRWLAKKFDCKTGKINWCQKKFDQYMTAKDQRSKDTITKYKSCLAEVIRKVGV